MERKSSEEQSQTPHGGHKAPTLETVEAVKFPLKRNGPTMYQDKLKTNHINSNLHRP